MEYSSLILVGSIPSSGVELNATAFSAVLSLTVFCIAGWWIFGKNSSSDDLSTDDRSTVDQYPKNPASPQVASDSDNHGTINANPHDSPGDFSEAAPLESVPPKSKMRSDRWKSPTSSSTPEAAESEVALQYRQQLKKEKRTVHLLRKKLQQVEDELHELRQQSQSPESTARNRQALLDKNKAIVERNKAVERLNRYKQRMVELEQLLSAQGQKARQDSDTSNNDESDPAKVRIRELEQRLENAQAAKAELEKSLSTSSGENGRLAELLRQLKDRVTQFEKRNHKLTADLDLAAKESVDSESRVQESLLKIEHLSQTLKKERSLAEESVLWKQRCEKLDSEKQNLEQRLDSVRESIEAVKEQQKKTNQSHSAKLAELQKANFELQSNADQLTQQLNDAQDADKSNAVAAEQLQESVRVLENQIASNQSEHEKELAGKDEALAETQNQLQELAVKLEESATWQEESTKWRAESVKWQESSAELEKKAFELAAEIQGLQSGKAATETELQSKQDQLIEAEHQLQETKSNWLETQEQLRSANRSAEQIQQQFDAVQKELNELADQLHQANEKRTLAESNSKTALASLESTQAELESVRSEREDRETAHQAILSELNQTRPLVGDLKKELESVRQELASSGATGRQMEERLREAQALNGQLQDQMVSLDSEKNELAGQCESLEGQGQSHQAKIETLNSELDSAIGRAAQLERMLEANSENQVTKTQEHRKQAQLLEKYKQEILERDKEIELLQNVESHNTRLTKSNSELETQLAELHESFTELVREKETLVRQQKNAGQVANAVMTQPDPEMDELIEQRDRYRAKRRKVVRKYRRLNERFVNLQEQLAKANRQAGQLEHNLLLAQKQNDGLTQQLGLLESQSLGVDGSPDQETQRLRELIQELGFRLAAGHDKFKKLAIQYRKTRSRYKRYKDRLVEYKEMLERYRDDGDPIESLSDTVSGQASITLSE